MNIRVHTPPAVEPLDLEEVRLHLRLDEDDVTEVSLIQGLITAAREHVEAILNRALITQTLELVLDGWPAGNAIMLPRPPLQSVASVTYTDYAGTATVLSTSDYYVDNENDPAQIVLEYGQSWPSTTLRSTGAIVIQYVAGYGDAAADIPQAIVQAMLLLVGHWYETREAVQETRFAAGSKELPFTVSALLAPYRIWSF